MKKLKMVMFFVLCIVMAASLWAGGNRDSGSSSQVVTLRFSWWGTEPRHVATLAVIDAFHKQYPNIKIEPEYGAQAGYNEKKTTEFASRTAPDIFQIETGAGPEYQRLGVLYNLSRLNSISFEKFSPSFLVANGQFGTRQQYAIPTGMAGTAVIVNKTLADRLGIDFT
ncbi:MAG: extracellular solute-binding protein, partial [Treponema sp.]|nr:extracellular solute-binding protein [Treponema sp.]